LLETAEGPVETHTGPAPTRQATKSRRFELHYEAAIREAPSGSRNVDVWLPVAQDTDFQKVRINGLSAPAGHEIRIEPSLGNRILHVRVPASRLPLAVRIDYEIERAERRTDLAAQTNGASLARSERELYLAGTELVPVGEGVIAMSGFKASGSDPLATARAAYDHVMARMRYDKPADSGWGRGSTEWACKTGFGNCTDFHAYFMSLARTKGVPARFVMGLSLPTDKREGEVGGYHCWAEFFVDGRGWIPVDISEADKIADQQPEMIDYCFGGLTVDRVEFSSGRDVRLLPAQRGAPLNFFIDPYCEIDGTPAPKGTVIRKVTFKDL
jgi:transglutaminase-like putative cysteine protease